MASQRQSDENLNPNDASNPPDVVEARRLSASEKKNKVRFEKSGMKKGAIFQYIRVTKKDPEDATPPTAAIATNGRVMTNVNTNGNVGVGTQQCATATRSNSLSETNNNNGSNNNNNNGLLSNDHNGENEDGVVVNGSSQNSSVVFLEERNPNENRNVDVVEVSDDDDSDGVQVEDNEQEREIPVACVLDEGKSDGNEVNQDNGSLSYQEIQENEVPSSPSPENRRDSSEQDNEDLQCLGSHQWNNLNILQDSLSDLPELTPWNVVEEWQQRNKRLADPSTSAGIDDSFQPTPSKISRPTLNRSEMFQPRERTPGRESSVSSCSFAPLKITNVYSMQTPLNANMPTNPSNEGIPSSSVSKEKEGVKKAIFRYKEHNNSDVGIFLGKKNWKRALKLMAEDLQNNKLPKSSYVSVLIRRAILCDETRVAKVVQSESVQFMEDLISQYPPLHGNGTDSSVKYYKDIFENVFDIVSNDEGADEIAKLFKFLVEICSRVEVDLLSKVETNTLPLLVYVTDLVVNQFKEYSKDTEYVKVRPPLFQNFLEKKDGLYSYEPYGKKILNKLFSAKSLELICIYLKWVDLIAKSFSNGFRARDNQKLVEDAAQLCLKRSDLGLFYFLNLENRYFCKQVCEKIFENSLSVIPANAHEDHTQRKERNYQYLEEIATTLFFKPAEMVISDLCTETCPTNEKLTYTRTRMERSRDDPKGQEGKRKNMKGETGLHKLCNSTSLDDPVKEIKNHMSNNSHEINEQDNFGNTPLHDCTVGDKGHILMEFMNLHARGEIPVSINFLVRNKSLETPLHLAANFSSPQSVEILKFFARDCGVLQDVLMAPNGDGKLPFELADDATTRNKLKPIDYDVDEMLKTNNAILDSQSEEEVKNNFSLRKIIAWWYKNKDCQL